MISCAYRANLSNDYFTNRLDRYHVFSSKELSDYYGGIHHAVCSLSFSVLPDPHNASGYRLDWPMANGAPSPLEDPENFVAYASTVLNPLIQPSEKKHALSSSPSTSSKTYVYPVAQFTPLLKPDTSTEYPAVTAILR